jgi:putative DNA primase/helicase
MTVHDLLNKMKGVKRSGSGWTAQCPAHSDDRSSLSISQGDDGRILLYCFAKCSTENVCTALGIELKDLMPENTSQSRIVQTYDYRDETGTLLYQNCRFEPKDFRQRKPDGQGGWEWKLNGVRRVPYRLPELLNSAADVVYLVEGEKDVDNLTALGLTVTSLKNWRIEFNPFLAHFQTIIILQDHDRSGVKQAADAARTMRGTVRALKVVDLFDGEPLPDKHGKDVSDWLAAGGTVDQLQAIIESAPELSPDDAKDLPQIITSFSALMSRGFNDGEEIAFHACRGELVLIQSVTNHCKSTLTRNAAITLSAGGEFLSVVKSGTPRRVLLLNLEGAGGRFQSDLRLMTRDLTHSEMVLVRENFFPTHAPTIDDEPLSLSRHMDLIEAEALATQVDVAIIDTASAAFSIRSENDNSEVANHVMKRLVKLARRLNCLIVLVHHIGKAKTEEGSTREQAHRGRGASAWADFSTSIFNLEVDTGDKNRVTLTCGKRKDGENYETVLRLDRESRCQLASTETQTKPKTNDDLVVEAMETDGRHEIPTHAIVKALAGKVNERTVKNCLSRLADLGKIASSRRGWWSLAEFVQIVQPPIGTCTSCTIEDDSDKPFIDSDLQENPPSRFKQVEIEGVPLLVVQDDMEVF